MEATKYLDAFSRMNEELKDEFTLFDDCLIVEKIPSKEVTTKSGIAIAGKDARISSHSQSMAADLPTTVRILLVGKGYYDDETKKDIPLDSKPGDIAVVGEHSVHWLPVFGDMNDVAHTYKIGIMREREIKLRFKGQRSYEKVFSFLNEAL